MMLGMLYEPCETVASQGVQFLVNESLVRRKLRFPNNLMVRVPMWVICSISSQLAALIASTFKRDGPHEGKISPAA